MSAVGFCPVTTDTKRLNVGWKQFWEIGNMRGMTRRTTSDRNNTVDIFFCKFGFIVAGITKVRLAGPQELFRIGTVRRMAAGAHADKCVA